MGWKRNKLSRGAILVYVLGLLSCSLRIRLEGQRDVRGYLPQNTGIYFAVLLCAVVGVLLPVLLGKSIRISETMTEKKGVIWTVLDIFAAVMCLMTILSPEAPETKPVLLLLWQLSAVVAMASYLVEGYFHLRGRTTQLPLKAAPCIFLLIFLVCNYQNWCNTPQFVEYLFALLASISGVLLLYHRCAVTVELEAPEKLCVPMLMALFFAAASRTGSESLISGIILVEALNTFFSLEAEV